MQQRAWCGGLHFHGRLSAHLSGSGFSFFFFFFLRVLACTVAAVFFLVLLWLCCRCSSSCVPTEANTDGPLGTCTCSFACHWPCRPAQVRKKDDGKIYAMKVLKKEMILRRKQYEHTVAERQYVTDGLLLFCFVVCCCCLLRCC